MNYKYGEFTGNQIREHKKYMRKQIFFLLLIVDPFTKDQYSDVNVPVAFDSLLHEFSGFNSIMMDPQPMVRVMSLLEAALQEYQSDHFSFRRYRKYILDAGAEVLKIKEVG